MISFKTYSSLPADAVFIRQKVFVEEQGFQDEFDETDQKAQHIVLYMDSFPAAVCRFFSVMKNRLML